MRATRRLPLIIAAGLAAVVAVSACGVAANDTAGTVGDVTISATLVNDLASDDAFVGAMASQALDTQREGVVDGDSARQVLSFLVTSEVLAQEVQHWGAEVTDANTADGESTIDQQAPRLQGRARDVVLRYLVDRAALQERLSSLDPSSEEDMRRLYDGAPSYWDQVCLTAVVVPADAIADARAALAGGSTLEDLEAAADGSQVVATPEQCLPRQYLPEVLRDRVAAAKAGEVEGPVAGAFPGQDAVVWFRIERTQVLAFPDAGPDLEQLVRAIAQNGVDAWLNLKANQAVEIDPRYGSEVEVGQQGLTVLAPATPLGAGSSRLADAMTGATP